MEAQAKICGSLVAIVELLLVTTRLADQTVTKGRSRLRVLQFKGYCGAQHIVQTIEPTHRWLLKLEQSDRCCVTVEAANLTNMSTCLANVSNTSHPPMTP